QSEMEHGGDRRLRLGTQIDQKIAARNQIKARKWRIGQHIVNGADHRRAQFGQYSIPVILPGKEPSKSRRRHVGLDRLRVQAFSRGVYRIRVDIGSEDLELYAAFLLRDLLAEEHRKGISLLARAA